MPNSAGVQVARISVKVSPDTREFRRTLKSDLDEIEKSITAKIDVEPNMNGFKQKVGAATKGMSTKVKVDADVDRSFFGRITDKLNDIKGPGFGSGINPTGYAVILAGITALAAPLLGLVTTALLALPGLISLVATPIAALALGIDGLKEAAGRLAEPFQKLKDTMSQAVANQFGPVFDQLGRVFPSLQATLPSVTQGLADMAKSVADVLTSPAGLTSIENTITNIGKALTNAAPGIGNFTDGLLKLVENFTGDSLSGLVDWFNGAGKSFNDWISDLTKQDWFGNSKMSKAFAGLGDTLKVVVDMLGKAAKIGMEWASDPSKVENFVNGLKSLANILTSIVSLSNTISSSNLFGNMLPSVDLEGMKQDFLAPFTSEDAGWRGMWDGIKQGWQATVSWFQTTGGQLTAYFSQLWSNITGATGMMWDTIKGAASAAANGVSTAWNQLVGMAQSWWSQISSGASGAWNGVVAAAQSAWNGIVSAVSGAVSSVISTVSNMVSSVISALSGLLSAGAEAGRNLVQGLINGIGGMISAAVSKAQELASGVAGAVKNFLGIHSPSRLMAEYGQYTVEGFGVGMENGFQPVLDQAKDMAQRISDAFASGADPTASLAGYNKKDVDRMEKTLAFETKRLENQAKALDYQAKLTGNDSLKDQAKAIRMKKDELSLQKDMLDLTQEYSDTLSDTDGDPLVKAAAGLMNAPVDFAKATGKQFMSDLGIGGNGLISKAITEGISYIFQIGSVDEALSIKDREESKQALAFMGR